VSEYGPALFVSRKDRAALPEDERAAVLRHVRAACRRVRLTDGEGRRAEPELRLRMGTPAATVPHERWWPARGIA
jgi:hypothetical protein